MKDNVCATRESTKAGGCLMSDKHTTFELVIRLQKSEPEAVTKTLAMMAYNPAIGRVLEKGGVDRFQDLVWEIIPKLYQVQSSREDFDRLHAQTCEQLMRSLKTAKGNTLSYGQAQKPVNVFLKVYVDWAKQPTPELAAKLAPMLHVPLDSVLMKSIKQQFTQSYEDRIASIRYRRIDQIAERVAALGYPRSVAAGLVRQEFSLVGIDKETYLAWQELLRSLYPAKPVLLDVIWSLERRKANGVEEEC